MNQHFNIHPLSDESKFKPVQGSELFDGAVFYKKTELGFERSVVDLSELDTAEKKFYYKATIKKESKAGLLFVRREKPFHDFRDIQFSATVNYSPGRQIILTRKP